jgi:hypothetical protein
VDFAEHEENKMSDRVHHGVKAPPATRQEREQFLRERLELMQERTPEQMAELARQAKAVFQGGFNLRDEANAIVCMAVRNGPIENLHAGRSSPLLKDDTLSRLTDDEIKAIMISASEMVAFLLWLRDNAPDFYKDYLQRSGMTYCRKWERGE